MADGDRADRARQLTARRQELLRRAAAAEEELRSHNAADWEERATERETDEVLEQLEDDVAAEVRAIDAALARIGSGEYGACMRCGAEISAARLDLLPHTPWCRNCAAA